MSGSQRFIALLTISLFIVSGSACQQRIDNTAVPSPTSNTSGDANPDSPVVIHLAVYSYLEDGYRRLVNTFNDENTDIQVEIVLIDRLLDLRDPAVTPQDIQQITAHSADVLTLDTDDSVVQQGLRLDLTPFIENGQFDSEDFYPGLLAQYQWDGGLWALPVAAQFDLVAFNKTLFDQANHPYPQPGWTWEEFLDAAQALIQQNDAGDVTQWGYVDERIMSAAIPPDLTGPLLAPNSNPPQPRLDDPTFMDGVQGYLDLFSAHHVAPLDDDLVGTGRTMRDLINGNRAALWRENSVSLSPFPYGVNWGVVPFPGVSLMTADSVAISAGSQNPQAAWQLVEFLSHQLLQTGLSDAPQGLPARRSTTQSSDFYNLIEPELAAALRYAVEYASPLSNSAAERITRQALATAVNESLTKNEPVAQTLARAQETAQSAIAQALSAPQTIPTPDFVVAAPVFVPVADSETGTTIVYAPIGGPFQREALDDVAAAFQQAHPDITLLMQPSEFSESNTLSNVAASSDCFEWRWPFDVTEASAAVLSLEPFLDADAAVSKNDFFPVLAAQFSSNGQLIGLPSEAGVSLIGYDKSLFDAAGVPYPTDDWTTDDFLEKAVALTQGDGAGKQYGYLSEPFEEADFYDWVSWLVPTLVDEMALPPRLVLDDPAIAEAVRWYVSLIEYGVKPQFLTPDGGFIDPVTGKSERELKESGQAAMWLQFNLLNAPKRRREFGENIAFVLIPSAPDGTRHSSGGGFQVGRGLFISRQSAPPPACWQWIAYLSQQYLGVGDIGIVPARRSVAESDAYQQTVGREIAVTYITMLDSLEPSQAQEYAWLSARFRYTVSRWVYTHILFESVPVEAALAQAQDKADAYRDCVIERDGFADFAVQQACLDESFPPP